MKALHAAVSPQAQAKQRERIASGRKEEMARRKKAPPIKAAPVTQSHGYADALRIGSLTELEKQWLYWRAPSRRDAERARPWNTYKG